MNEAIFGGWFGLMNCDDAIWLRKLAARLLSLRQQSIGAIEVWVWVYVGSRITFRGKWTSISEVVEFVLSISEEAHVTAGRATAN